jgi:hypothetical protein
MKTISLKLNTDLASKKAGDIVTVKVDANKTIIDQYWRRRFEDSAIDGCVEVVVETKTKGDKS